MRMEQSLRLLAVTAIEDQLQPGVPRTIKSLKVQPPVPCSQYVQNSGFY